MQLAITLIFSCHSQMLAWKSGFVSPHINIESLLNEIEMNSLGVPELISPHWIAFLSYLSRPLIYLQIKMYADLSSRSFPPTARQCLSELRQRHVTLSQFSWSCMNFISGSSLSLLMSIGLLMSWQQDCSMLLMARYVPVERDTDWIEDPVLLVVQEVDGVLHSQAEQRAEAMPVECITLGLFCSWGLFSLAVQLPSII